ncbi:cysteine-rich receptor-like protein kinase [Tanacetum coccineum]
MKKTICKSQKDSLIEIVVRNESSMLSDVKPMFDDREVEFSSPSTQAKKEAKKVVEVAVMMGMSCDGSLEDLKEKVYQMELLDNHTVVWKKRAICSFLCKEDPYMVLPQETKLKIFDIKELKKIWKLNDLEARWSNFEGASGGIIIMWKKGFFKLLDHTEEYSFILLKGIQVWKHHVNVCAPNDMGDRRGLWSILRNHKVAAPWTLLPGALPPDPVIRGFAPNDNHNNAIQVCTPHNPDLLNIYHDYTLVNQVNPLHLNHIGDAKSPTEVLLNPSVAKKAIADFFKEHFNNCRGPFLRPLNGAFKSISLLEFNGLEAPFSESEIKAAVWGYGDDRVPGPDGLNLKLFKQNWHVINNGMTRFSDEFHANGCFPKAFSKSFIALIPKKSCPQGLNDFKPISLISSMYNVLAKVLAERIKSVMKSVVSQAQFAIMKNRQITDCILIANEVIHSLKKSKKGGLILKVDFEKAYDIIEWTFLDRVFKEMNFGSKWRKWIHFCLSSATVVVLVNGSPTEFFLMKRGLR